MAYYGSNYYDTYLGESYQTAYGGNYDIVPSQALWGESGHDEFSNQSFYGYDWSSTPYYSVYNPGINQSMAAYSAYSYSEPKSIVYDIYDGGGHSTEVVTQFRVSYSVAESADVEFEEYDPTPYDGGYNQAQTYGNSLPHSEAICYPRSQLGSSSPPLDGVTNKSAEPPKEEAKVIESSPKPDIEDEKPPAKEEQKQLQQPEEVDAGSEMQDQEDNPPESDDVIGYTEGNNYEYDEIVPSGYGLEAMDLCDGLFGYWPCLEKYQKRCQECQQVVDCGEDSCDNWKETADYLFGSSYPYEERRAGDVISSYQRHHPTQPLYLQTEYDQDSWMSNIFL